MQIYVVMTQGNILQNAPAQPVVAFSDYPTALKYAQGIFQYRLGSRETAKDLIFLINLTQTPVTPTPTPVTTPVAA